MLQLVLLSIFLQLQGLESPQLLQQFLLYILLDLILQKLLVVLFLHCLLLCDVVIDRFDVEVEFKVGHILLKTDQPMQDILLVLYVIDDFLLKLLEVLLKHDDR